MEWVKHLVVPRLAIFKIQDLGISKKVTLLRVPVSGGSMGNFGDMLCSLDKDQTTTWHKEARA